MTINEIASKAALGPHLVMSGHTRWYPVPTGLDCRDRSAECITVPCFPHHYSEDQHLRRYALQYVVPSLAIPSAGDVAKPRTIIRKYTQRNARDAGLPTPNVTKKAMPESVYGRTDSTTIATTAKYKDAYPCPRCSWTFLPSRTTQ